MRATFSARRRTEHRLVIDTYLDLLLLVSDHGTLLEPIRRFPGDLDTNGICATKLVTLLDNENYINPRTDASLVQGRRLPVIFQYKIYHNSRPGKPSRCRACGLDRFHP